jgi:hypothetical protein
MSDKDFKVKNKLIVNGLDNTSGVILATNNQLDSHTLLPTQYGGTGTTTSPASGQILYSTSGATYAPTDLSSLVIPTTFSNDAPSSPVTGQVWIEADSDATAFDTNIIRRQAFTATAGQTVFTTTVPFIDTYEQVFYNGVLILRTTDYTTSNSNTITLVSAAAVNDIIEVLTVTNLNSVNTYTQAEINSAILVAVPSQTGNNGKYLTTDGSLTSWGTISGYSAPTLGSTSIASGATVTTVAGLTLTAPTLTGTVTASGDINLSAVGGPGSLIDELTLILMGAI